jgi:hypothetical protein
MVQLSRVPNLMMLPIRKGRRKGVSMPVPQVALKCSGCELPIPIACRRCKRPFTPPPTLAEMTNDLKAARDKICALEIELAVANEFAPRLFPDILPTAREWAQVLIDEAMRRTGGNRQRAGVLIGIGNTTIYRKTSKEPQ